MFKRILIFCLLSFTSVSSVFAVGQVDLSKVTVNASTRVLKYTCVGDVSDGSIPDTLLTENQFIFIKGWDLVSVQFVNSSTDVDVSTNSDVFLKDEQGFDVLRGQGIDQLDPDKINSPLLINYDAAFSLLTLSVENQSLPSAKYTLFFIFKR